MALVRFGSCGAVQPDIAVGVVCVCEQGCTLITQNPDAYGHDAPKGELKFRFDLHILC
jgi:uridine phosphorylase